MDAIRIENLRSLADTGFIELKPITLLLGENNSGKSTFLRTFPLLRQSVEVNTAGPILWYGQLVDFGSFEEVLNRAAKKREIAFHFRLRIPAKPKESGRYVGWANLSILEELTLHLTLKMGEEEGWTRLNECVLSFADHTIRLQFKEGKVTQFLVNGRDFSDIGYFDISPDTQLVPSLSERTLVDTNITYQRVLRENRAFVKRLASEIAQHLNESNGQHIFRIIDIIDTCGVGHSSSMLKEMQSNSLLVSLSNKQITSWSTSSQDFHALRDLLIANKISDLLAAIDRYMVDFAKNSDYIPPIRAFAKRYYRLQDIAVDEVDVQADNLAIFLLNLSQHEHDALAEWMKQYFGFTPLVRSNGGHISLYLKPVKSSHEFNIADMGFGFSQFLPIITQLWVITYKSKPMRRQPGVPITFAIEQPELHLHPRLEGKLADSFLAAIKAAKENGIDLRLIIETQSETMVNRFGHRIANQDVDHQDINVVIFDKRGPDRPTQVRLAQYDEEGYLTNWPFAFFEPDEV